MAAIAHLRLLSWAGEHNPFPSPRAGQTWGRWHHRAYVAPRSWGAIASRSLAPTGPTPTRPTRTCSPPPWTGWSAGSGSRTSGWARWPRERSLPVLAHLIDCETGAVDFVHGDDGLLTAPLYAVPRLLERHKLGLEDFDF